MPTSIIGKTPLDCTLCQESICGSRFANGTHFDPQYYFRWVKKHCTSTGIKAIVMYFPYILIFSGIILSLIDKGFNSFLQVRIND